MTMDMNNDKELYASELRTMLKEALIAAIEGEFSAHPDSPYFYTKKTYPMFTEIDNLPLYPHHIPEVLITWAGLDSRLRGNGKEGSGIDKEDNWYSDKINKDEILVLDLETTGLGRGETLAFMIGLGYYENEQFIVEQIFLPDPDAEISSFDRLITLLQSKSVLITFNGKTFDVPVLESRLLYHQIWLNLRAMQHIDLLHIARRLWKKKLPSCALETIEFYVLGHIRDRELDIEGGQIPQTYFQYLINGEPELVRRIFVHNHHDILHTAALFTLICDSIDYPPPHGMDIRIDYHALAMLYKNQNKPDIAKRILIDLLANGVITADITRDLGLLYKKDADLASALDCFQIAADLACPVAMLELCKLQENHLKQFPEALEVANKLKSHLLGRYIVDTKKVAAVELRIERIERKISFQHRGKQSSTEKNREFNKE
ncbi:MAG: ribonuclease H-like domain-containing protein [Candidatus Cloacimonetes bacterium]|nr:ribonuclease H-like domain-containing protein [Candidatus Cloacimonadota bacterium]